MTGWAGVAVWALAVSAVHVRDRRRGVLAARARHEIRGPLSAARLALDGLEPSARVQAVDLELRRAALAVDDLTGRRRDRFEPVDVGELLNEASAAWRPRAAAASRTFTLQPPAAPALVDADPLRLVQAYANLVANAVEHGRGPIRVRTRAVSGRVRIEVTDAGPGLPKPLPALIAAARGRRSARGHGLAIAAAIADRHGGRLVASASGGAGLVLDLPEAPPTPTPASGRLLAPAILGRLGPAILGRLAPAIHGRLGPAILGRLAPAVALCRAVIGARLAPTPRRSS